MVVFLSGVRTGFGAFGGSLRNLSATELGTVASQGAIQRSGLAPGDIGHVVFGNVAQTSSDAAYLARHIGLRSGLLVETPAVTVNRLCGSGFEAIVQGAQLIMLEEADAVLAGGAEAMSLAPHIVRGARWGLRLGTPPPLEDMLWTALTDAHCGMSMAQTAERLADQYDLKRDEVDHVAWLSQQRANAAWQSHRFADEVVPIALTDPRTRETTEWARDEHMRPDTTPEGLAKLPPYFKKEGLVTAGNASGIVDGGAAVVLASEKFASQKGVRPIGRLVSWGFAGVDPRIMGIGPVPASKKALARANLTLEQMDLVEINEAFAAQYLAVERELGLDRTRTNAEGGAVAIGHPLAATGTRIALHLLHALRRTGGRYGLGAACIGGGQGAAVVVEALSA
ncbi:MAG TPA: acetyl-CoA C-acetyltransferase [Gemmatimonadales bacterium]|nr:acetyl-CoA C-acetyltransferase [Gemmatimonadales bacterium]